MLVCAVNVDTAFSQALLEHDPPPPEHGRIRLAAPILGMGSHGNVVQLKPPTRFQILQAISHVSRPVMNTVDQNAAVDQVERLRGPRPVALGVCDREAAVWWSRLWLRESDVDI